MLRNANEAVTFPATFDAVGSGSFEDFSLCPVPRGSDTAEMKAAWFDELCLSNFISFF